MTQKKHLYAYTGDVVFQDTEGMTACYFDDFKKAIANDIKLIINLESPFIESDSVAIKDKICLGADINTASNLARLAPDLINLSNNHINDYGTSGIRTTIQILRHLNLEFFGIGKVGRIENVYEKDQSVINISFTLRSADQSGGLLFATEDIDGPGDLDLTAISKFKQDYPSKNIVVSVHWGNEDISVPDSTIRNIARSIIDAGADLIIGHHPHIIQPVEIYKGKMIFYSLGNFYFPEIKYKFRDSELIKKPLKHQRVGIVPIFLIREKIELARILMVKNNADNMAVSEIDVKKLIKSELFYSLYPLLHKKNEIIRLTKYYPKRLIERGLMCLGLNRN